MSSMSLISEDYVLNKKKNVERNFVASNMVDGYLHKVIKTITPLDKPDDVARARGWQS